ncbi:hypothetical protein Patl1_05351 [Pistacia atlantica]|uniref:Uncharacterized protein n=1 Tax=Pistacia atlantica TaxID=434234 RepID=A0ACC1BPN2_9ROSI|nr:hypothetical protein Patl1_05351 [Pistacia atlantica]
MSMVAALLATLTFAVADDNDKPPEIKHSTVDKNKPELAMVGDPAFLRSAIFYSKNLLNIALFGTLVAFITGLYTVISPESEWLAIIVVIIGSSVPFLIKFLHRKSSTSNPRVIKYVKGTMKKPVITYSLGRRRSNLSYGYVKPNHFTASFSPSPNFSKFPPPSSLSSSCFRVVCRGGSHAPYAASELKLALHDALDSTGIDTTYARCLSI